MAYIAVRIVRDTCRIKGLEPVSEFNLARDFTILEPSVVTCNLH